MIRTAVLFASVALTAALVPSAAPAQDWPGPFTPGAAGVGDPYFPLGGNGGYDVGHYDLDLGYSPATDRLQGVARIHATATQDLSAFNLDLDGLRVQSVRVNHQAASWHRDRGELIIQPRHGLPEDVAFTAEVRYGGRPETLDEFGASGFFHTDDGAVVVGQPHVAATWFPVNDHPIDKASYTFHITVPHGLKAVANGHLRGREVHGERSTWTWRAREPMASYLTTMAIGDFRLKAYRDRGIRYWDAVDQDLLVPAPRTGDQFAISRRTRESEPSYKRLRHPIDVPAAGAELSFWVDRQTEPGWDFLFVEARTVGEQDWTTLPDANGHTTRNTGRVCPFWFGLHPFLRHYQSARGDGCAPSGTTARWWAASGESDGWERWSIDLSGYAGSPVRVSLSYASDDLVQLPGVFVDDVVVSTGQGTSFEDDGDAFDGWRVPGAPAGSAPNPNDWVAGTTADAPPPTGRIAQRSFARQGEIIAFLADQFGPYPFSTAGGILDDEDRLAFALETQTRPVYAEGFFTDTVSGDSVVVHELAHQWFGDSLALRRWRHIWLNEGFATYAEWMWGEEEGFDTAQETFDFFYGAFPANDPFWDVRIGDPGPEALFDFAVYARGAMTLHRLRLRIGDDDFFRTLRSWADRRAGGNVATRGFVRLAERVSGQELDRFFERWLFTPHKPRLPGAAASSSARVGPEVVRRLTKH